MGLLNEIGQVYGDGVKAAVKSLSNLPRRPAATRYQRQAPFVRGAPARRQQSLIINDELQHAVKSVSYSDFINDFINAEGTNWRNNYSEQQIESAYATSVYLFAAMRRVANLFSMVRFVAEVDKGGDWQRLPDTHHLNKIFTVAGARFMYHLYMYYALYGTTLVYKRKTRKALAAYQRGKLISGYLEGGIAGLSVIPNSRWEIFEDEYQGEIQGFSLNEPMGELKAGMRDRDEFVYIHDFDPRFLNNGISMVSLAINNAITNAAIARWAAHYFMSGAMPLLLISTEEDPAMQTEADLIRQKNFIERAWQGLFGKFAMRAVFTDRKLNVQQAGIDAEKVQAPDLNRDSLNAIASVFQIAPDLIVPPEGGSDNARHKFLMMDAFRSAILPVAWQMTDVFNADMGLHDANVRIVVAEDEITALDADRADNATTETGLFTSGIQTFGETRDQMRFKPSPGLKLLESFININGRLQSVERVLRDDQLPSDFIMQYAPTAWDAGIVKRSEVRKLMFNLPTPAAEDGYKYEVVPDPSAGGGFGGGGTPSPEPPENGGGSLPAGDRPQLPGKTPQGGTVAPTVAPTDGDKAVDQNRQIVDFAGIESAETDGRIIPVTPVARLTASATQQHSACALLMIGDDPLIQTVATQLEIMLDGVPAIWQDPETYHCTLVYSDHATDDQIAAAQKLMPEYMPDITLRVDGLITFETQDGLCIALRVDTTQGLEGLQSHTRTSFSNAALPISPYSASGAYMPHITLCYVPDETPVPEFTCAISVVPQCIQVTRDEYKVVFELPSIREAAGDDPNHAHNRQMLIDDAEITRQFVQSALRTWRDTGEPGPGLSDAVKNVVREALAQDAAMAWDAALKACDDGYFDDSADLTDGHNPILGVMAKAKLAMQETPEAELDAWERSAFRNGVSKAASRFEVNLLPLALEQTVKARLADVKTKTEIKLVFNDARAALAESAPKAVDEDSLMAWAERVAGMDGLGDLLDDDLTS